MYRASAPKKLTKADFAVVLGNKAYSKDSLSNRLEARLNKAIEIYNAELVDYIIVSGGIDPEGINEAEAMMHYLRRKNVRLSHILVDSLGNNTHRTAQNVKEMLKNSERLIVVSERFHTPRCKLAFNNAGFTKVQVSSPDFFEARTIYSWIREVPAYCKYYIKKL